MKRTLALLGVVTLLTACPGGNGLGGEGEGESATEGEGATPAGINEGEPLLLNNSVEIQNVTIAEFSDGSPQAPDNFFDIVQVSIERSGSGVSNPINIGDDPIGPQDAQEFCCYADGTYDVRVVAVFESGVQDEDLEANNVFMGPRTHVFQVNGGNNSAGITPRD